MQHLTLSCKKKEENIDFLNFSGSEVISPLFSKPDAVQELICCK